MISMSLIFALMMLPGVAVLATSFIVRIFEASPRKISRKLTENLQSQNQNCWEAEV